MGIKGNGPGKIMMAFFVNVWKQVHPPISIGISLWGVIPAITVFSFYGTVFLFIVARFISL